MTTEQNGQPDLRSGPKTDAETDALLDTLDLLPPASTDHGSGAHDLGRAAARRVQAVRLRMSGATYDQIAEACGYSDKGSARHAVMRALTRLEAESVGELRALENARLDADEVVLRSLIADRSQTANTRIRAIDSRLRLSARRARLNGLDAPLQVALSAGVTAELEDALAEAAALIEGEVLDVLDEPLTAEEA